MSTFYIDQIDTFSDPEKEGWIWKQGGRCKSWKHRWFLIQNHCLYYFVSPTDEKPRGIIPLENILVREANDEHKPNCFELYRSDDNIIKACKTQSSCGKIVKGHHMSYLMSVSTEEERDGWIENIRRYNCQFHDNVLEAKRRSKIPVTSGFNRYVIF